MAGSIYTYVRNSSSNNRIASIETAQGTVLLGQSGLFIASDVESATDQGCVLVPGPSVSPASQLTAATAVAGSAGALTGVYRYAFTFVTAAGETKIGPEVTVTLASQEGSLSNIPFGNAQAGVIARKMYRTIAGGASGAEKLVGTISDNTTTTAIDNLADGSLGVLVPISDTSATIAGGGSVATQVVYAELTENPADDAYAIGAGTGQKISPSGGVGVTITSPDGSVTIGGTAFEPTLEVSGASGVTKAFAIAISAALG